tara:strand:+ start:10512 stop:12425 length:1914 start_codon:yes stop_codon:yes gene_type:complete
MASDEDIEDWVKGLDEVTQSMRDVSRLQTGIIKGFTDITKTSTATGQAWVSVARFFSGTGFWRIQNKIKAISNLLQGAQILEQRRLKQEQEMLEETIKREKALKNVEKVLEATSKITDTDVDNTARKILFGSKYFKTLQMTLGTTTALAEIETRMQKAKVKIMAAEKDHDSLLIRQMKKRLKDNDDLLVKKERFVEVGKEEQRALAKMQSLEEEKLILRNALNSTADADEQNEINEKLVEIRKQQASLAGELSDKGFEFKVEGRRRYKGGKKKGQLARNRKEQTLSGTDVDKLADAGQDFTISEITISDDDMKQFTFWEKQKSKWRKRSEKFEEMKQKAADKLKKFRTGLSKLNLKMVGNFFKMAGLVFGKIILFITLFVIGFFLLQKLGIFKYLRGVFDGIVATIGFIVEFVGNLISAFAEFWSATEELFNGDGSFWERLLNFAVAFGELAYQLILGVWETVIGPAIMALIITPLLEWGGRLMEKFGFASDNLGAMIVGAIFIVIALVVAIKLILIAIPVILAAMPFIIVGALVVALVGALATAIGKAFGFKAEGGPASGLTVVGERGPEILDVPSGSRVYSNQQSKGMVGNTTNITVNVQGRIGASDAEVRDMATKVSKIISREINRSTSSGTRG